MSARTAQPEPHPSRDHKVRAFDAIEELVKYLSRRTRIYNRSNPEIRDFNPSTQELIPAYAPRQLVAELADDCSNQLYADLRSKVLRTGQTAGIPLSELSARLSTIQEAAAPMFDGTGPYVPAIPPMLRSAINKLIELRDYYCCAGDSDHQQPKGVNLSPKFAITWWAEKVVFCGRNRLLKVLKERAIYFERPNMGRGICIDLDGLNDNERQRYDRQTKANTGKQM
jgi:hypothetical protein